MNAQRFDHILLIRVDRGEDLLEGIKAACLEHQVKLGYVSGIGATDYASIGWYSVHEQKYYETVLEGEHEITHLSGNITTMNDDYYGHFHVTLSDKKGHAFGGHLKQCRISATSEVFVQVVDGRVDRTHNQDLGLNELTF